MLLMKKGGQPLPAKKTRPKAPKPNSQPQGWLYESVFIYLLDLWDPGSDLIDEDYVSGGISRG